MANVNKVILIGNLTRDPEIKFTAKGTAVADISLAINRSFASEGGEKREETTYVDVTLWGRTAEIANEYLKKGRPVFIEGRLQLDTWEDKTSGQKRSKLHVVGENLQFLGGRQGNEGGGSDDEGSSSSGGYSRGGGGQQRSQGGGQSAPPASRPAPPADEDDDIPF